MREVKTWCYRCGKERYCKLITLPDGNKFYCRECLERFSVNIFKAFEELC